MMIKINDRSSLVDICDISIDKSLTKTERITEYVRQIKNPHHFRCGQFTVTVKYSDNNTTIEDCLRGILI